MPVAQLEAIPGLRGRLCARGRGCATGRVSRRELPDLNEVIVDNPAHPEDSHRKRRLRTGARAR